MDDEVRLAKIAAFKERDAARKREQRRIAKLNREKSAQAERAEIAPSAADADIVRARELCRQIIEAARKDAEALIVCAQEQAEATAKAVAVNLENSAKEKIKALENEAKEKVRELELDAETYAKKTKERCIEFVKNALQNVQNQIPESVLGDDERVMDFIHGLPVQTTTPSVFIDDAKMKRKRAEDARRQRKCYNRKKLATEIEKGILSNRDVDLGGSSRGAISAASVRFVATTVIESFECRTSKCTVDFKQKVWDRIWQNPRIEQFIPKVFSNAREAEAMIYAIGNLKRAIHATKDGARRDHLAAKYILLSGMVDQGTVDNRHISQISKLLGIKKANLIAAVSRRRELDQDATLSWPLGKRKTKSGRRILSVEVKEKVIEWWNTETRILPGRKDIIRHRVATNLYEIHTIQILDETQLEFFRRFKERFPGIRIGQRAFEYLKPYYVRVLKDRYVCCCQAHVQMNYLKEALNAMRVKVHRSEICTCQCSQLCRDLNLPREGESRRCRGHLQIWESVTDLWEMCVCPKEFGQAWHNIACLNGKCSLCGVKKLIFCPQELESESSTEVLWRSFDQVVVYPNGKTPKGREVSNGGKRIKLIQNTSSPAELVKFVKGRLPHYIKHNFRAKWQTRQYQECLKVFPPGVVVSVIDFAENYSFQIQDEIQSMHWHSDQITLLIHITYRHDMTTPTRAGPTVDGSLLRDIIKNYHIYISEDKEHDSLFVHHCLEKHARWLEQEGVDYYEHWVWSDGAASQFKCARNFYYIARNHMLHGRAMRWFFFGSGHGKGEHDGAGGVIKRALRFEQLKQNGVPLQNAKDAHEFLQERLGGVVKNDEGGTIRYFWLIGRNDVNRTTRWGCKTLQGSRSLHAFVGCNPRSSTMVKTRSLACLCTSCIDGDDLGCENQHWCGDWVTHELNPTSVDDEIDLFEAMGRCEIETEEARCENFKSDGEEDDPIISAEERACLVERGDNFAIVAEQPNPDGVSFYILKCDEPAHILEKEIVAEHWSNANFRAGDLVITGKYYQQVRKGNLDRFLLLDDRPSATIIAEAVRYVHLPMKPYKGGKGPNRRFYLDPEHLAAIESSLSEFDTSGATDCGAESEEDDSEEDGDGP